ncbi:MAG: porin [Candidatus Accumulibacter sp.]|jgi:predicted porin|nr:porin [Accumulibacter sp.]
MQKKLIALAVAGLVSGAAYAQTNVTIYGVADASFEVVQAKSAEVNGQDIKNFSRVNSNSSILGFRGSEDLGGGLKALFQMETNINLEAGGLNGSQRDTFVGLQGNAGQIKLGFLTGSARSLGATVDLVAGATGVASAIPLMGKLGGDNGAGFSYWDTRIANAVQYVTPKFGGFEVRALYGAGENRATSGTAVNKAGKTYEIGAFYNNGPWYAGLVYGQAKAERAGFVGGPTAALPGSGLGTLEKRSIIRFGGTYTFQAGHKIAVLVEQNKADDWSGLNVAGEDVKSRTYGLGGKFKVSQPGAIIAQVYHVAKLKGADDANDYKANFFSVGYEHSLSKRTMIRAFYSRINNKDAALYNYGIGRITQGPTDTGIGVGSAPTAFSVGLRHTF